MSGLKTLVAAGTALAAATVLPAQSHAQVSSSGPLGGVNPWGVGWIAAKDGALPGSLWSQTDAQNLSPLFQSIQPVALSPAEMEIARRVLLSGGRAPAGADAGLALQRIRLLDALGATDAALDLERRFRGQEWSSDPAETETDRDLMSGNHARACRRVADAASDTPFWVRARIACLVLAQDFATAALTSDVARSSDIDDPWLFAIADSAGDADAPLPPARFDTGVAAAVSISEGLQAPLNGFDNVPAASAALLLERDTLEEAVREQAAIKAALYGHIKAARARDVIVKSDQPHSELAQTVRQAVDAVANPELEIEDKAAQLSRALKTGLGDPRRFGLVAQLLLPEIRSIPQEPDYKTFAPIFIRSAIGAGELDLARRWRDVIEMEPPPPPVEMTDPEIAPETGLATTEASPPTVEKNEPLIAEDVSAALADAFSARDKLELDILLMLAGDSAARFDAVSALDHVFDDGEPLTLSGIRLLRIADASGLEMSAGARRALSHGLTQLPPRGGEIASELARLNSAYRAGALGEAMLHAVKVLRMSRASGVADALSIGGVVTFLYEIGQDDLAEQVALEAAGLFDRTS